MTKIALIAKKIHLICFREKIYKSWLNKIFGYEQPNFRVFPVKAACGY